MAALAKVARIANLAAVKRLIGIHRITDRGAFCTSLLSDKLRLSDKLFPSLIAR